MSSVEKRYVNKSMGLITMLTGKDPDSKKLKKKYIGDHVPKNKEPNDDCYNESQIL
jgi:hypothetical protein